MNMYFTNINKSEIPRSDQETTWQKHKYIIQIK